MSEIVAADSHAKTYADYVLPSSVVSKIDVSHLVSEIELVDNELTAAAIRTKVDGKQYANPTLSGQLMEFLTQNSLKLMSGQERAEIIKQLRLLKDKVPVIRMTFAVEADNESLQQLTEWIRTSIHPQAVISVGLQPALVAGVYLRTPNHVHDLSLRGALAGSHDVLIKELEAYRGRS